MRRRRQGGHKKVCQMCSVFRGVHEAQYVSSLRCVLYTVAACDLNVFGPQREARIECKHVCKKCFTMLIILKLST